MKFSRIVFLVAGIYGVLIITPLYFLERFISESSGSAINHPEFFYGFVGLALCWQIAFLIIATDPLRYRKLMYVACLEKLSFGVAVPLLFWQGRVDWTMLPGPAVDLLLFVFFVAAIRATRGVAAAGEATAEATNSTP